MFDSSTHGKYWLFASQQAMEQIHQETNTSLKQRVQTNELKEEDWLTWREEKLVIQNTVQNLQLICNRLQLSLSIQSTATVYFRRFFLYSSIMEFDMTHLMFCTRLASIFCACKVEETVYTIPQFLHRLEEVVDVSALKPEILRKTELYLLEGILFHLYVYHPFRSINALLYEFSQQHNNTNLETIVEASKHIIQLLYLTDAIFLHKPGQLALFALYQASLESNHSTLLSFCQSKLSSLSKELITFFEEAKSISQEPLKSILKKLKKVRKVVSKWETEQEQKLLQQKDEKKHAKQIEKAVKLAKEEDEFLRGDSFGGNGGGLFG